MFLVSIIVPTYKEAENVSALIESIDRAMKRASMLYEVIFVDDNSCDGVDAVVQALQKRGFPIRLKVRVNERGLSSAVITGFSLAKGDYYLVMDADLSHPPERIPALVVPLVDGTADFVVGSRFLQGGSVAHFNYLRRLNARVAKALARPFSGIADPMAGFFAFPSHLLRDVSILNPLGFKIGLEILVKCEPQRVLEVPIRFRERLYGRSKLSLKEQILYLLHLKRLFCYKYTKMCGFLRVCTKGCLVVFISLILLYYA